MQRVEVKKYFPERLENRSFGEIYRVDENDIHNRASVLRDRRREAVVLLFLRHRHWYRQEQPALVQFSRGSSCLAEVAWSRLPRVQNQVKIL